MERSAAANPEDHNHALLPALFLSLALSSWILALSTTAAFIALLLHEVQVHLYSPLPISNDCILTCCEVASATVSMLYHCSPKSLHSRSSL